MLAITPLRSNNDGNIKGGATDPNFSIGPEDFPDFTGSNLLDSIDFDDLFMGMHDGDVLPDLEMDPELFAEFSISNNTCEGDESSDNNNSSSIENNINICPNSDDNGNLGLFDGYYEGSNNFNDDGVVTQLLVIEKEQSMGKKTPKEEIGGKKDVKVESIALKNSSSLSNESGEKGKKSSSFNSRSNSNNSNNNNNQAKRKTKVDWTPELHRRFVQAVEQLGVDKAVPSRILELMGIDCLTRHNIASHLQKYRSHRKHLLAREAEAANWTQKRQMYGVAMGGGKGGGGNNRPWYPPTMGFPPMTTMHPSFRPLHVWGHPTMKPIVPSTTPLPLGWATPPPHHPPDPSFWHSSHHRRVGVAPVPGLSLPAMFRHDQHGLPPQPQSQSIGSHSPLDPHPSKESIDAAIGDVLAKPWQPLPIGLKPPSMDTVLVELQRQGIPKIPPSS